MKNKRTITININEETANQFTMFCSAHGLKRNYMIEKIMTDFCRDNKNATSERVSLELQKILKILFKIAKEIDLNISDFNFEEKDLEENYEEEENQSWK